MEYMGTYNLARATKRIYDSGFNLLTLKTLRDILDIDKESSLFSVLSRLAKAEILEKVEKGKYIVKLGATNDLAIANFIYQPSYVSFETALNFYGILSQFPYEITSATPKKPLKKELDGKIYSYIHIKKALYWGYKRETDFIIALAEKALLDQIYLASKGLKRLSFDEYDLSKVERSKFKTYLNLFPKTRQFMNMVRKINFYDNA